VGKIAWHGLTAWATARRDFAHAVGLGGAPLPTLRNSSDAEILSAFARLFAYSRCGAFERNGASESWRRTAIGGGRDPGCRGALTC